MGWGDFDMPINLPKKFDHHEVILQSIRCDKIGLTQLGAFSNSVKNLRNCRINVDCHCADQIDANMAAAIYAIKERLEANGNIVHFHGFRMKVREVLARNGFLPYRSADNFRTSIPLRKFSLKDGKIFAEYADSHLRGRWVPQMSDLLRQEFLRGVNELFNNSAIHSRSTDGVFACGQAYPGTQRLDFSLVDLGVGFWQNVSTHLGQDMAPDEAIDWAMRDDNTTRAGDIPGGLGLKIIREFIEINGGMLTIYSDAGYWSLGRGGVKKATLSQSFGGTLVNLRINTDDKSMYCLYSEVNPDDIF